MKIVRAVIVEDDADNLDALDAQLRDLGYDVAGTARSASEARDLLSLSPDVCLVDVRLGDDDGFTVAEGFIRECGSGIVMMSGAYDLGNLAVPRLTKPFGLSDLIEALRQAGQVPSSAQTA